MQGQFLTQSVTLDATYSLRGDVGHIFEVYTREVH